MKQVFTMILVLVMTFALAACGVTATETPEVTEVATEVIVEPTVAAGTYIYNEDKGNMGVTPWTIELSEGGACVITEGNSFIGDQVHVCTWTDNGDGTFGTGAWDDASGPKSDFFAEDGSAAWKIVDEDTCEPVNGTPSLEGENLAAALAAASSVTDNGAPPENGPTEGNMDGPIAAGTYVYNENKGDMGIIPWTIELFEDGTARITEANSFIGDQVHECESWTDNGDGTFTTGAWDNTTGPKSDFFAEDGTSTWKVTGDGTCEPVTD